MEEHRSAQTDLSLCDYPTNLTQNGLASDSGLQGERPETNRLEGCTGKGCFMCQRVMKIKQLAMQNDIFGPSRGGGKRRMSVRCPQHTSRQIYSQSAEHQLALLKLFMVFFLF